MAWPEDRVVVAQEPDPDNSLRQWESIKTSLQRGPDFVTVPRHDPFGVDTAHEVIDPPLIELDRAVEDD